jgi:hypothetical protein
MGTIRILTSLNKERNYFFFLLYIMSKELQNFRNILTIEIYAKLIT